MHNKKQHFTMCTICFVVRQPQIATCTTFEQSEEISLSSKGETYGSKKSVIYISSRQRWPVFLTAPCLTENGPVFRPLNVTERDVTGTSDGVNGT